MNIQLFISKTPAKNAGHSKVRHLLNREIELDLHPQDEWAHHYRPGKRGSSSSWVVWGIFNA